MPGIRFQDQKANRKPNRNCRSSFLALVMVRKSPLVMSPLGLLKCGELNRLAASARNCNSRRSVNLNVRNRLKSKFTEPGPSKLLRPTFPYTPTKLGATEANELGS